MISKSRQCVSAQSVKVVGFKGIVKDEEAVTLFLFKANDCL